MSSQFHTRAHALHIHTHKNTPTHTPYPFFFSTLPAPKYSRAGTFYLPAPLVLSPADSRVTFMAYPGEEVWISGGVPVAGVTWAPATPPARSAYEHRPGVLSAGFDVAPMATLTVAQAQAQCTATPLCLGFTYNSSDPSPSE